MRRLLLALALCSSASLNGCATIIRLAHLPEPPQIYGGVRNHVEHFPYGHLETRRSGSNRDNMGNGSPSVIGGMIGGMIRRILIPLVVIDFPLSVALDTAFLPVTIPSEIIYNSRQKESSNGQVGDPDELVRRKSRDVLDRWETSPSTIEIE